MDKVRQGYEFLLKGAPTGPLESVDDLKRHRSKEPRKPTSELAPLPDVALLPDDIDFDDASAPTQG